MNDWEVIEEAERNARCSLEKQETEHEREASETEPRGES